MPRQQQFQQSGHSFSSHLISQEELSKLQVVALKDGGAVQLGQWVARSVGRP